MDDGHAGSEPQPDDHWSVRLIEELLERSDQTPEELNARAAQLRAAYRSDESDGAREGAFSLAALYEQAARDAGASS